MIILLEERKVKEIKTEKNAIKKEKRRYKAI